jgi:hypothetical protein
MDHQKCQIYARFEVLIVGSMNFAVLWDVILCSLVGIYHPIILPLKWKEQTSPKMLVNIVMCMVVHATKMTGSSSDDWIY